MKASPGRWSKSLRRARSTTFRVKNSGPAKVALGRRGTWICV